MRLQWIALISAAAACFAGVCGVLATLRGWGRTIRRIADGEKCVLRSAMLSVYYKHLEDRTLRQYEYENFLRCYEAYTAMGGNSFMDEISEKVKTWSVTT